MPFQRPLLWRESRVSDQLQCGHPPILKFFRVGFAKTDTVAGASCCPISSGRIQRARLASLQTVDKTRLERRWTIQKRRHRRCEGSGAPNFWNCQFRRKECFSRTRFEQDQWRSFRNRNLPTTSIRFPNAERIMN